MPPPTSTPLALVESGPQHELWVSHETSVRLTWSDRNALQITTVGHAGGGCNAPTIERLTALAQRGRVAVFFDSSAIRTFDTAHRIGMQEWFRANRASVAAAYLVCHSRSVARGINAFAARLPGMLEIVDEVEFAGQLARYGLSMHTLQLAGTSARRQSL